LKEQIENYQTFNLAENCLNKIISSIDENEGRGHAMEKKLNKKNKQNYN
jgi:hypothetical protein